jgi:hypothetical protein
MHLPTASLNAKKKSEMVAYSSLVKIQEPHFVAYFSYFETDSILLRASENLTIEVRKVSPVRCDHGELPPTEVNLNAITASDAPDSDEASFDLAPPGENNPVSNAHIPPDRCLTAACEGKSKLAVLPLFFESSSFFGTLAFSSCSEEGDLKSLFL